MGVFIKTGFYRCYSVMKASRIKMKGRDWVLVIPHMAIFSLFFKYICVAGPAFGMKGENEQ